ncbi:MAG TPA: hypothetical protein DCZ91_06285 [Lachnospiraceae bacterium]|nr:hypothetical protein [Lachnospiraceae bacterium]
MRHKWIRTLAVALGAMLALPLMGSAAQDLDLSKDCSLTVSPGGEETAALLAEANVVVDLYKVAEATQSSGVDGYGFQVLGDYGSLTIGADMDNDAWKDLAQDAARIALGVDPGTQPKLPIVSGAPLGTDITDSDGSEALTPGLYLMIARGANVADYVTTIKAEDGTESIVTVAYSGDYIIRFAPELVAVPSKEADENGVISTLNPGDWIYGLTVFLKPDLEERDGSLEIIKDLLTYEDSSEALFLFQVEAVLDGQLVYSDIVSMTFNAPGEQRKLLEGIPVGAEVTVTEVYSGASYTLVSGPNGPVVISADEVASVTFVNDYDYSERESHGITNNFTFDLENGEWVWVQE